MKLNQIVLDIFDWIRRLVWYKTGSVKKKPYEILNIIKSKKGILRLIQRDTVRAVRSYIYTPSVQIVEGQVRASSNYDIHLCLDHLWALDSTEVDIIPSIEAKIINKRHGPGSPTHQVTIIKASRFVDKEGNYAISNHVYEKSFDFVGYSTYRDRYAIPIFDFVILFLKNRDLDDIDFDIEFELSRKQFMGRDYSVPKTITS